MLRARGGGAQPPCPNERDGLAWRLQTTATAPPATFQVIRKYESCHTPSNNRFPMTDAIRTLYECRAYPAMSHPLSDPAVSAVAAMLGGLDVPNPMTAEILEIGCSSGHNLIPLALRWPGARFTGIDLSEGAIRSARELAAAAGLCNIEFHAADLRDYCRHCGEFDFIIAHGFFSWVADDVKAAMLDFCGSHLTQSGIATVSFNLESGWRQRFPVIQKARAILQAGAADETTALAILRSATSPGSPDLEIIDDMLAKGGSILPFDDFAPINDPWSLGRFVDSASNAGLHWLGESDPGYNLPRPLAPKQVESLRDGVSDPLSFQQALDEAAGRTFRSGMLCRRDAPLSGGFNLARVFQLSARAGEPAVSLENPTDDLIFRLVSSWHPSCLPLAGLRSLAPENDPRELARRIHRGIMQGWLLPRIEPMEISPDSPTKPKLDTFRMECARRRLPLVDAWHRPCSFPTHHYGILEALDGSRSQDSLAVLAADLAPDLDSRPWFDHLAERGLLVEQAARANSYFPE